MQYCQDQFSQYFFTNNVCDIYASWNTKPYTMLHIMKCSLYSTLGITVNLIEYMHSVTAAAMQSIHTTVCMKFSQTGKEQRIKILC